MTRAEELYKEGFETEVILPQPAWESKIILTVKDVDNLRGWQPLKEVEKNLKPLNKVIVERVFKLLATERLKWQEEARKEISEWIKNGYGASANIEYPQGMINDLLRLASLTPPPQEETK